MIKIGLTGGIGCGKSLVAQLLEKHGVRIISADQIAKELVNSHSDIKAALIAEFGEAIYTTQGILDRKKVAAMVFSNPDVRKKINEIIHPNVLQQQNEALTKLEATKAVAIAGVEAALIYEAQAEHQFDLMVVVSAPINEVIERLKDRDGLTEQEILSRINSQMPLAEKEKRADYIITNDGSIEGLEKKVILLINWIKHLKT